MASPFPISILQSPPETPAATDFVVGIDAASYEPKNFTLSALRDFVIGAAVVATGFWSDVDASPQYLRHAGRVFIGDGAVSATGVRTSVQGVWPVVADGPNWMVRDSQLIVHSTNGLLAISGFSRSSDQDWDATACIGVSGAAIGDGVQGSPRAFYGDLVNITNNFAVGMELAVKNRKAEVTADAYNTSASGNGTFGLTINTGDNAYGGDGAYNGTAAITIAGGNSGNTYKWNLGIMFQSAGLAVDGNGRSVAMAFGQKTGMKWYVSYGNIGSEIRGDNNTVGANTSLVFEANTINLYGPNDKRVFQAAYVTNAINYVKLSGSIASNPLKIEAAGDDTAIGIYYITKGTSPHRFMVSGGTSNEDFRVGGVSASPVNFIHIYGQASGTSPVIAAAGAGTDLDIRFVPKGTGVMSFGTWTTSGDVAVNGYVTIKDSSGNTRKLATIA